MANTPDTSLGLQGISHTEAAWLGVGEADGRMVDFGFTPKDVVLGVADAAAEWAHEHRGHIAGVALPLAALALSGCSAVDSVAEAVGGSGEFVSKNLDALYLKPENIVPVAVVGGIYGLSQVAWSVTGARLFRGRPKPFKETSQFKQLVKAATTMGLAASEDPKNPDALADPLSEFLEQLGFGGGRTELSIKDELIQRLKTVPRQELEEWWRAGTLMFATLSLLSTMDLSPNRPGFAFRALILAVSSYFTLNAAKQAILPTKQ